MLSNLPFFPQSFPDETLLSRISRYHLLSGNRSEHATFRDLFDSPPFPINVVIPKQIDKLAARLPGQMDETLQQLLAENTLLSLFTPFFGASPGLRRVLSHASHPLLVRAAEGCDFLPLNDDV